MWFAVMLVAVSVVVWVALLWLSAAIAELFRSPTARRGVTRSRWSRFLLAGLGLMGVAWLAYGNITPDLATGVASDVWARASQLVAQQDVPLGLIVAFGAGFGMRHLLAAVGISRRRAPRYPPDEFKQTQ